MEKQLNYFTFKIKECKLCNFIDKPFLIFDVYKKMLPEKTKILIVVESPPPGKKEDFFYNLQKFDRLRRNFEIIFRTKDIISFLKKKGIFVTNAIKCRPLRGKKSYRDEKILFEMAENCSKFLKEEIGILKPEHIIAMGKIAKFSLSLIKMKPDYIFPHPNYLVRFKRKELEKIREKILSLC